LEIINGKAIADEINKGLKDSNNQAGITPCLAIINIGDAKDNLLYIGLKKKAVDSIGGQTRIYQLPGDLKREALLEKIYQLNQDREVDGILLQLPLPASLEPYREEFLGAIVPHKDVDGFSPSNRGGLMGGQPQFISCAALACMDICKRYVKPLKSKKVLLAGNSFDIIEPLALMFIKEECRVTIIPQYYPEAMENIDIAVIEHGSPLGVRAQFIKAGALIIDAGFYWHQDRMCGNVDKNAVSSVEGYLLPVPGGMGPLLIAQLMVNLSHAAQRK
jgi:methylenetetrahydrofolate dehydrogenase (NADP+)/methenyltetrahydrofolate cyclohydrolase